MPLDREPIDGVDPHMGRKGAKSVKAKAVEFLTPIRRIFAIARKSWTDTFWIAVSASVALGGLELHDRGWGFLANLTTVLGAVMFTLLSVRVAWAFSSDGLLHREQRLAAQSAMKAILSRPDIHNLRIVMVLPGFWFDKELELSVGEKLKEEGEGARQMGVEKLRKKKGSTRLAKHFWNSQKSTGVFEGDLVVSRDVYLANDLKMLAAQAGLDPDDVSLITDTRLMTYAVGDRLHSHKNTMDGIKKVDHVILIGSRSNLLTTRIMQRFGVLVTRSSEDCQDAIQINKTATNEPENFREIDDSLAYIAHIKFKDVPATVLAGVDSIGTARLGDLLRRRDVHPTLEDTLDQITAQPLSQPDRLTMSVLRVPPAGKRHDGIWSRKSEPVEISYDGNLLTTNFVDFMQEPGEPIDLRDTTADTSTSDSQPDLTPPA